MQVMIIENDPSLGRLYREELLEAGYQVQVMTDMRGAMRSLRRRPAHVLITDLDMAGCKPETWLKDLRQHHRGGVLLLGRHPKGLSRLAGCPVLEKSSDLSPLLKRLQSMTGSVVWGRFSGTA